MLRWQTGMVGDWADKAQTAGAGCSSTKSINTSSVGVVHGWVLSGMCAAAPLDSVWRWRGTDVTDIIPAINLIKQHFLSCSVAAQPGHGWFACARVARATEPNFHERKQCLTTLGTTTRYPGGHTQTHTHSDKCRYICDRKQDTLALL